MIIFKKILKSIGITFINHVMLSVAAYVPSFILWFFWWYFFEHTSEVAAGVFFLLPFEILIISASCVLSILIHSLVQKRLIFFWRERGLLIFACALLTISTFSRFRNALFKLALNSDY